MFSCGPQVLTLLSSCLGSRLSWVLCHCFPSDRIYVSLLSLDKHRPPWVLNDVRLDYSFLVSLLLPDMDSAASLRIRRRACGVRDACLARAGVPGPEGERPRSMHGGMRMCRGAFRAQMRARVWVCALARMGSNRIVPRTSVMSEAATRGAARGGVVCATLRLVAAEVVCQSCGYALCGS